MKKTELLDFLKRNKNFSLVWSSQILSCVTVNIVNFMMMTKIYERTGSSLAVSFLWVFYYIPAFFLGPFSGIFVDHWKKRNVLMYTNFLQSMTVLLFLLIGDKFYTVYPFVFLYSLIDEFYGPAQASSIPHLVKRNDLPMANSLFFVTGQGALLVGFGLSGPLMRLLGENNLIFLASFLLLAGGLSGYFLPKDEPERKKIENITRFWTELKLGYSYIASKRIVLYPLILSVFFGVILSSIGVSLPAIANQLFKIQVKDAGPLIIVPLGLGALSAISLITKLKQKYRKKSLMTFGLKIVLSDFLLLSLVLPFLGKYILVPGILLAFILGFGGLLIFIPNQTLLQENIPSKLRGRVFGTLGFATTAITLPVLLFSATLIDTAGISPFLFFAGMIVLIFLLFIKKAEDAVIAEKNGVINGNH